MSPDLARADSIPPCGQADDGLVSVIMIPLVRILAAVFLILAFLFAHRGLAVFSLLMLVPPFVVNAWARYGTGSVHSICAADKTRLFPGEALDLTLMVENRRWLPLGLQIGRLETAGFKHLPDDTRLSGRHALLGYQRMGLKWKLGAQRRGVYRIAVPGLAAGDVFGFCLQPQKTQAAVEVVVYPRVRPLPMVGMPGRWFFGQLPCRGPVPDPAYFLGTRDYHSRQSTRFIHWKASARYQRLQEKIFEPTRLGKVLLIVETGNFHGRADAFEQMLETAASLAVKMDGLGYALGLLSDCGLEGQPWVHIPVSNNPGRAALILEALARLEPRSTTPMTDLLTRTTSLSWGVAVLYCSLGMDDGNRLAEAYFSLKKIPVLFVVAQDSGWQSSGTILMDDLYRSPGDGSCSNAGIAPGAEEMIP